MSTIIESQKLIMTEVGTNNNKHYRLDLLDDGTCFAEWGRVGYGTDTKIYTDVDFRKAHAHSAKDFFDKQLRKKEKKGYTKLKTVDAGTKAGASVVSNSELGSIAKSQLLKSSNPLLEKLIERFVQSNIHKITENTQIKYNSSTGLFSTPLGIVTLDGLDEARNILASIAPLVRKGEYGDSLNRLVSTYLRIIPQNVGMRLKVENLLPDESSILKQNDLLDSLESSYKAFQKTPVVADKAKPVTKVEQVFKVDLDVCNDSKEIDRITKWFNSSNRATHGYSHVKVQNFYTVKIHDQWNGFNEKVGNIKETWHGTGQANLLSILKSGLRAQPPSSVAICGSLFGPGHYGAIDSSKSMQYTFGRFTGRSSSGDSGWLFVTEFALGNTYYIRSYGGKRPAGYDSIWAKKENTGLRFDELIVPNDSQVRVKYLLELK